MSKITGILCQVITGDVANAGTDGRIYLGIGGREFRLDSQADDYERGSWREYVLGVGPVEPNLPPPQTRVQNPGENDPRIGFVLDTLYLSSAPIYVRFEPTGDSPNWNLQSVAALVYSNQFVVGYTPPFGFDNMWLGDPYGKILFLTEQWGRNENAVLDVGRQRARK